MTIQELSKEFRQLNHEDVGINFEDMEDGKELFWCRTRGVYKDRVIIKNGKEVIKKDDIFVRYDYQLFRVLLVKKHHKSVSGWEPCVIAAPNGEFPYPVPWQNDWIYAYRSDLYVRKEKQNEDN